MSYDDWLTDMGEAAREEWQCVACMRLFSLPINAEPSDYGQEIGDFDGELAGDMRHVGRCIGGAFICTECLKRYWSCRNCRHFAAGCPMCDDPDPAEVDVDQPCSEHAVIRKLGAR